MKKLILFTSLFVLIFSCKKEDERTVLTQNLSLSGDCLIDFPITDWSSESCINNILDTNIFCEKVVVDEVFRLNEEEKQWLKYFCLDDFSKIFYHDENDNETFLEFSGSNIYGLLTNSLNGFDDCPSEPEKQRFYCINSEFATVEVESQDKNFSASIRLSKDFERPFSTPLKEITMLSISRFEVIDTSTINFINHFSAPISDETGGILNFLFFEEIEILGKTFKNVYSYENFFNSDHVKIFYNQEFGIVSFIDQSRKQWVLND